MRFAIIEENTVVNVVVASLDFGLSQGWVQCPENVGVGWTFDGSGDPTAPPVDLDSIANQIRLERSRLLAESDSQVLLDRWAAMSSEQQSAWAAYRQALRDIPQQAGFPTQIDWPVKP